jgi:hypothetical protein
LKLAIAHVVFGLIAAKVPMKLGFSLIVISGFCQAFLLALGATASPASRSTKIAWLVSGVVYLEILFVVALKGPSPLAGLGAITIALTVAAVLTLRANGVRFIRRLGTDLPRWPATESMKFSIRGVMLLIAAVAGLCALARTLKPIPFPDKTLPFNVFFSLSCVTLGLAAVWAVLRPPNPLARAMIVSIASPFLGVLLAIAAGDIGPDWVLIIVTITVYSLSMLTSLLLVRSCGYRLV